MFKHNKFGEFLKQKKPPLAAGVTSGMLSFLKRIPDKSVSILTCGIDTCIIDWRYGEKMGAEIERVLHPDGGWLRRTSDAISVNEDTLKRTHLVSLFGATDWVQKRI